MKISYGITVYNEYKELDNLLFHLSKHIREEDEVVVTQDVSKVGTGVFEPEFQALEKVLEKYEYGTYFQPRQLKVSTFHFTKDFLDNISNKIVNNVKGINRVVYDISSKPPSTIELE